jgi:hypothetical protein
MTKKKLSPYKKEKVKKALAITGAGLLGAAAVGTGAYYLYKNTKKKPIPKVDEVIQMEEVFTPPPPKMITYPESVQDKGIPEDEAQLLEHFEYALKKLKISHVQDYKRTYESFCVYYKKYKDFLDLLCKYSGNDAQKDACITRNLRDRYKIENLHQKAKKLASRQCK